MLHIRLLIVIDEIIFFKYRMLKNTCYISSQGRKLLRSRRGKGRDRSRNRGSDRGRGRAWCSSSVRACLRYEYSLLCLALRSDGFLGEVFCHYAYVPVFRLTANTKYRIQKTDYHSLHWVACWCVIQLAPLK